MAENTRGVNEKPRAAAGLGGHYLGNLGKHQMRDGYSRKKLDKD